jgi:bacteriocin-like protein
MATRKISNLDSDDSNLFSPLTDEETKNIVGGRLDSEGGGRRQPVRQPLVITTPLTNTTVIGDTNRPGR